MGQCPICGRPLTRQDRADGFPWPRPADAVVIYQPPDQVLAGALVEVLQGRGIKAIALGYYNPYTGNNLLARSSIAAAHGLYGGAWGRIFVFRRDGERALGIIREWLSGSPLWPDGIGPEPSPAPAKQE